MVSHIEMQSALRPVGIAPGRHCAPPRSAFSPYLAVSLVGIRPVGIRARTRGLLLFKMAVEHVDEKVLHNFAKRFANNEPRQRKKALKRLKGWMEARSGNVKNEVSRNTVVPARRPQVCGCTGVGNNCSCCSGTAVPAAPALR